MSNRIITRNESRVGILGENILINGKDITAFYILDLLNYSVASESGIDSHIDRLEKMISILSKNRTKLQFTIFPFKKIITKEDIRKNLIDTVRIWDNSYQDLPKIILDNLEDASESFAILAINIEVTDIGDVESLTIKEVFKSFISNITTELLMKQNINIDTKRVLDIERSIYNTISNNVERASAELVFYTYVSNIYPSYEISYDNNSFISNNQSEIMGVVDNNFVGKFGYFEMENEGVDIFGYTPQKTYASILKVVELPEEIYSSQFPLDVPNIMIHARLMPKKEAEITIKRMRADIEFEEDTALDAGARDTGHIQEDKDLAQKALNHLAKDGIITEMEISILVLATSLEDLRKRRQNIISHLANDNIFVSFELDQANSYINNYVKLRPQSYTHISDLRYALSFQADNGTRVGDTGGKYFSPPIGKGL